MSIVPCLVLPIASWPSYRFLRRQVSWSGIPISLFIYFNLILFFKLYIIVLVLPNIQMNPPQVYMCSPSWTFLPPPSPFHLFKMGILRILKNFPQFVLIHTVKVFSVINEGEVDVFLEFSCFSMIQWMLAVWYLVPLPFIFYVFLYFICQVAPCLSFFYI